MNKVEKEHKEILFTWVNDWAFKAIVLDYNEAETLKKVLHRQRDEYTDEQRTTLNEIREKWFKHLNHEYDDIIPEFMKI